MNPSYPIPNRPGSMGLYGSEGNGLVNIEMQFNNFHWSKGKQINIEGDAFLVTYRLDIDWEAALTQPRAAASDKILLDLRLIRLSEVSAIAFAETMKARSIRDLSSQSPKAQEAVRKTMSMSNLKQLGIATILYAGDAEDILPLVHSTKAMQELLLPYTKSRDIFVSPYDDKSPYLYNVRLRNRSLSSFDAPNTVPTWYESRPIGDPPTRGVAFVDGSARRVPEPEFLQMAIKHNLVTTYNK